jgi:hypothetical protein
MWYASVVPLIEERSRVTPTPEPLRVLVCGDRNWTDAGKIMLALKRVVVEAGDTRRVVVVHGKARGADTLGGVAAKALGLEVEEHPAKWAEYGRAAGPIRNQEMLDSGLAYAVACHSDLTTSKGTKDMVSRLEKAGVPYELVT